MRFGMIGALIGLILLAPIIGLTRLGQAWLAYNQIPLEIIHDKWGLAVTEIVIVSDHFILTVPHLVWGFLISTLLGFWLGTREKRRRRIYGIIAGLILGLPLLLITWVLADTWLQRFILSLLFAIQFIAWGIGYIAIYKRIVPLPDAITSQTDEERHTLQRRRFLFGIGSLAMLFALPLEFWALRISRERRIRLAEALYLPDDFPSTVVAQIYRPTTAAEFPEQKYARFRPANHPLGICFSGGGGRSMSLSVGYMRGLYTLGMQDHIGAISCVSGGGWFGSLFTYAPTHFSDEQLLGPVIEPELLTLSKLAEIDPYMIAAQLTTMADSEMLDAAHHIIQSLVLSESQPYSRFYARLLNYFLLRPFGLDDHHRLFTLDATVLQNILTLNPTLTADRFYTTRANRPYLICGSTHIYPPGLEQVLRQVELTPIYAGMPQFFPGAGHHGVDLGGGYVDTFAFDSPGPTHVDADNRLTTPIPHPFFLLSDMIGSTSAALGMMLAEYQEPHFMPIFYTWPFGTNIPTKAFPYSIVDGGGIENLGIIPLLRRQYPVILIFNNTGLQLGSEGGYMTDGIDDAITRLFGISPANQGTNQQDTQIFRREQFTDLAKGLQSAYANGRAAAYVDRYEIIQPNAFELAPYPDDGKVTIVWVYNALNGSWWDKLSTEVQELLQDPNPQRRMNTFPYMNIIGQNRNDEGIPQVLYMAPEQINLLAHMACYNLMHDIKEPLEAALAPYL